MFPVVPRGPRMVSTRTKHRWRIDLRQSFPEWYAPGHDDIKTMLTTGTIALDANVLLDLYRVGASERAQILEVFNNPDVRPRLWIPYQAALEFQRNRVGVAATHSKQYDAIAEHVNGVVKSILNVVDRLRDESVRELLREQVAGHLDPVAAQLTDIVKELQTENAIQLDTTSSGDEVRDAIDQLLSEPHQVGSKPDETTISTRLVEMERRYEDDIPPGYADASKSSNPEGDLFNWFELLDHHRSSSRPLIFVTSDAKPDWYEQNKGKTAGPRRELRIEMMEQSEHPYHQMRLKRFLELANEHLSGNVEPETLRVVSSLSEQRLRESLIYSQLQHPSIRTTIDRVVNNLSAGDPVYEAVLPAYLILEGEVPYNEATLVAALRTVKRLLQFDDEDRLKSSPMPNIPSDPEHFRKHAAPADSWQESDGPGSSRDVDSPHQLKTLIDEWTRKPRPDFLYPK